MGHLLKPKERERLWSKVNVRSTEECWNWLGSKKSGGHGCHEVNRIHEHTLVVTRTIMADLGYLDLFDTESYICHKCNNPSCVNPNHLYVGDHWHNMADVVKSGTRQGENANCSRLSEEEVRFIKHQLKYHDTRGLASELARIFGVTRETIRQIRNEKLWKHIKV